MICLTGDVHHMSLYPRHQAIGDGRISEVDSLATYLSIARENGLKTTVFVTGKGVLEEGAKLADLIDPDRVEIGGHTYSAFRPKIIYGTAARLLKLSNGPAFFQRRDIRLTVKTIAQGLGIRIRSWRDHAYRHDRNTYRLLGENGIRFVSDEVRPFNPPVSTGEKGLLSVPINTTPDHENLKHYCENAPFIASTWVEKVIEEVRTLHELRLPAVILAHPICMFVEDRFASFQRLCERLKGYPSCTMKEIGRL
jgi:hypothetical protein